MIRCLSSVSACLLIAGVLSAAEPPKVDNGWAVLIGVDKYDFAQPRKYCGTDQQALRERLVTSGFQAERVFLLHDKATEPRLQPTKANIERKIDAVVQSARAEELVVVAFSGHGVLRDGKRYLCPGNCSLDDAATLISLDGLYDRLKTITANFKLIVVDASRNDPPSGAKPVPGGKRALARTLHEEKLPEAVLLMNSCAPGEVAWEDEKLGRSVFMNYLLDGLGGAADENADGAVSMRELQAHVITRTKRHATDTFLATQRPFFKGDLSIEALEYRLIPVKPNP